MMKRTFWILPPCTLGLLLAACGADEAGSDAASAGGSAPSGPSSNGGTSTVVGATGATTSVGGATSTGQSGTDPLATFCSGKGPMVAVADGTTSTSYETCTGKIAETRFGNALCTCNDATVAGYLKTRSFDSVRGGPTDTGGSVGINHLYSNTTGYTDVGGSLAIAGQSSLNFAGYLQVGGNFKAAGDVTVAGYTKIWLDAWLGGNFLDLGPVTIKGNLHRSGTMTAIPLSVDGTTVQESVSVANPCPCEPKDLLDVGFIVDGGKTKNDNATYGIQKNMLNAVVGNVEVTLPCGRFYFERIGGIGNIIVNVTGRVAVFVDGPFEAAGNVEFRLADAAELDLFVKGDLVLTGRAVFGNKERPAASRIYVGGSGDVLLIGADGFVGNVYAPKSKVTAIGYAQVYGSVFAKDFLIPGYANFVYDRAIQHAGDNCGTPGTGTPGTPGTPTTCSQCGTCTGGTACVGGTCGACRTDGDCCSPFVCMGGVCGEKLVML